jgi:hypothetical protein
MSTRECDGPETWACRWSFEYEQLERENMELLQALKSLLGWPDAFWAREKAREAIAKAEGK